MSDDYLRIIPDDPDFVPETAAGRRALDLLRLVAPSAEEVGTTQTEDVQFIDPGENLERVSCPRCNAPIEIAVWSELMDTAAAKAFRDLSVQLSCCSAHTSLNDLTYDWPAGFARFVLWARNADIGGQAPSAQVAEIGRALGCGVRQIVTHV